MRTIILCSRPTRTDGKNRLKSVGLPGGQNIAYNYDYNNHRVTRNDGTNTKSYLYYGNQVLEEQQNGNRLALYGWDGQGLISRTDKDGRSLFYLWDGLGSAIGIMDSTGKLVQNYEYSAYGENLSGKDLVNPFRYGGRFSGMSDDDTGLELFGNRWYDPITGRWISEDSLRGSSNLFRYVGNNPGVRIDPTGLAWTDWQHVRASLEGAAPGDESIPSRSVSPALRATTSGGLSTNSDLFVALPDEHVQGREITIFFRDTMIKVPVGDVGPWNGGHSRDGCRDYNDPYWDTNRRPETETSDKDLRGRPITSTIRPGIDISYRLGNLLGIHQGDPVDWKGAEDGDQ